jgi:hypothetical protein
MKYPINWKWTHIAEFFLAGIILTAIYKITVFFFSAGYLPPPFFDEASDTFMDWYNTLSGYLYILHFLLYSFRYLA